ncbi:hypothetical protein FEF26_12680 [Nesterenkonia salmonea]|uniref:DUF3558 domain-containing protein n=1 Tax=Nesterenkonia salmonea TaxID=1804987 RepID=A0A5R9B831_9MICC|nr:hypothetical protein [Nesterenkonia salmonea]TLP93882.1 hypothetical protein FEF26_12680 [Nesterenkonia salmonea]
MNRPVLKLTVFATASALALVGCIPSFEADSPESENPTTTQSPSDSPAPTEASGAPTPEETSTATEGTDTSDNEDGDLDEQDGVRTNSFNAMPAELGDMRLTNSQSNPAEHTIHRDYMAADEQSRMIFLAYIPSAEDGGYAPVSSASDSGFRTAVDSAQHYFEEDGFEIFERSAATGGYDWECFEALQTQTGNIDHSFCLTTGYGRVLELQRLAMHNPDEEARNSHMDALLEEVTSALADIGS